MLENQKKWEITYDTPVKLIANFLFGQNLKAASLLRNILLLHLALKKILYFIPFVIIFMFMYWLILS